MRYVDARLEDEDLKSSYRFFVSESLRILTKNTSNGNEAEILQINFPQYLEKRKQPEDTRTAEEIISDISNTLDMLGGKSHEHDSV